MSDPTADPKHAPDVTAIRQLTRVALPDDNAYLFRLGVALYGFAYLTQCMCESITYLKPDADRAAISTEMAGKILDTFRQAAKQYATTCPAVKPAVKKAGDEYEWLNTRRSDFVHGLTITGPAGEQILQRRDGKKGKDFNVDNGFLDDFLGRLSVACDALGEIRDIATS